MIDLPEYPSPNGAEAALIDFGAFLTPALGGPVQRINRLGNRHRINVSMPTMQNDKYGRAWVNSLKRGKTEGARMEWPLLGFKPGNPGTVLVNGADQAGTTLIVDGATANYAFRVDQPFSIETDGQHFLYFVAEETVADGSGNATLTITPALRRSPTNNDVCHFAKPMVEGFIHGNEMIWQMQLGNLLGIAFELHESE